MDYQRIDVARAKALIADASPAVVDVRDANSFAQASIPGAVHINYDNARTFMKGMPKTTPILVYCYHGNASRDMAQMFADFGYGEVYSLDGGFEAWRLSI